MCLRGSKSAISLEMTGCDCVLFFILQDTGTVTVNSLPILGPITDSSPRNDRYDLAKSSEHLLHSEVIESLQCEASAES